MSPRKRPRPQVPGSPSPFDTEDEAPPVEVDSDRLRESDTDSESSSETDTDMDSSSSSDDETDSLGPEQPSEEHRPLEAPVSVPGIPLTDAQWDAFREVRNVGVPWFVQAYRHTPRVDPELDLISCVEHLRPDDLEAVFRRARDFVSVPETWTCVLAVVWRVYYLHALHVTKVVFATGTHMDSNTRDVIVGGLELCLSYIKSLADRMRVWRRWQHVRLEHWDDEQRLPFSMYTTTLETWNGMCRSLQCWFEAINPLLGAIVKEQVLEVFPRVLAEPLPDDTRVIADMFASQ